MADYSNLPAWREQSLGRRWFLRVSAASAASVALVAAGCGTDTPTPVATADPLQLVLPANGPGLLYYAYLLALAQTRLFQQVVDAPPADFTATDRAVFADLRDHEIVHRETLRYFIDPTLALVLFPTDFAFNLTSFSLTTRSGALTAAQQLTDLAAAAYPVLLPLFSTVALNVAMTNTDSTVINTLVAQRNILLKVSSVAARHAAAVRDLLVPGSFADSTVVDANGLLITKTPTEVTAALAPYFAPYVISVANLPVPV